MATGVLVAGAGPVGLLLATELRLAGVPVTVVDRLAEPMAESRAAQLNPRTVEVLRERGFFGLLAEAVPEAGGHFAGLALASAAGYRKVPQYRTEAALAARAAELGVDLVRGRELTALDQHEHGVIARFGSTGLRAGYLVGCDGQDSTVRRLAGFEHTEVPPTREILRADVLGLRVPDRRFERHPRGVAVAATRAGRTRLMVHEFGRRPGPPPDYGALAAAWHRVTGEDVSHGEPVWVDAFDNTRALVTRYRRGRVLLAGDAAHRHLPVGGQSLNVGLQDALNLGWKLAATVRGDAPPGLLDSYHDERHPVAVRTMDLVTAQETLLFGGPEVEPVRSVLTELLDRPSVAAHLAGAIGGLDVRYPGTGGRLPETRLANGESTVDLLAAGRGLLLDRGPERVLVRPDGYVAWTGTEPGGLASALRRWFGEQRPPTARAAA
ncbi:FAD-dependent monooxygenase [Amycolatopsis sp. 195334CR]|uniref:FAD-dependent monooxygenase n=1 Tax=Amycolatopsis sp. 195334CR TaxID=2814588 RepID=UPI001A8CE654|nr:FAD-dependent monooxygenase [Amycolatopsis sp. 195334CR]MBN6040600.1 FAD-dependent monooxygenase [Amycolatopsis sp. 195334CR]